MIEIRCCEGMDELDACVALEMETWGYDETEVVPRKTFLLAQKIGGQVIGAFSSGDQGSGSGDQKIDSFGPPELIGFAMSLPGIKEAGSRPIPYLHSHMLAVKQSYRNQGIGVQLKREQRREALSRGIRHMEWTFDPLELKNAFLNIHRLGAIVRSYRPNFYGVSSSRLQAGLPTDRLLAEWELDSPRVQAHLDSNPAAATAAQTVERIMVPASIERWKANERDREHALTLQTENRDKFQQAFSRGLAVLGFSRDTDGNGVYELGIPEQAEQVLTAKAAKSL
jgi:predicted GNAT superfamily acetyltransferase